MKQNTQQQRRELSTLVSSITNEIKSEVYTLKIQDIKLIKLAIKNRLDNPSIEFNAKETTFIKSVLNNLSGRTNPMTTKQLVWLRSILQKSEPDNAANKVADWFPVISMGSLLHPWAYSKKTSEVDEVALSYDDTDLLSREIGKVLGYASHKYTAKQREFLESLSKRLPHNSKITSKQLNWLWTLLDKHK